MPSLHTKLSIKASVGRGLHIASEHGPNIAGDVPDASALEDFIGPVPRREDVERTGGGRRLEKAHEESHTVNHLTAVVAALDKCDDGPQGLADREVPSRQLGAGDDHHGGNLENEIADVVKGAEQVVLDSLNVQVLLHPRVVSIADVGLIEPFDEDYNMSDYWSFALHADE